jgi:hypothetical protein
MRIQARMCYNTIYPPFCSVFERFRAVLHEGEIDKRVQFIIEGLFAIRKAGFEASGFKAVKTELDLLEAGGSCCNLAHFRNDGVMMCFL